MDAIFIGSSEAAVGVLEELRNSGILVKLVVSRPDRKAGRGKTSTPTPVSDYARSEKLPLITPASWKDGTALAGVGQIGSQIIIVAACGVLLPTALLNLPEHGVLNIHPSLLPAYRGPSPVVTAVLEGVGVTGVTVMELNEGLEMGPIVAQREVKIDKSESTENLEKRLFAIGAELLINILPGWSSGEILGLKQNEEQATYTKRFNKSDGQIDWNQTTETIINQIRAFDPWPSTYVMWNGRILKILEAHIGLDAAQKYPINRPGTAMLYQSAGITFPALKTRDGILVLSEVQMDGKGVVTGQEFLNGYPQFIGAQL